MLLSRIMFFNLLNSCNLILYTFMRNEFSSFKVINSIFIQNEKWILSKV